GASPETRGSGRGEAEHPVIDRRHGAARRGLTRAGVLVALGCTLVSVIAVALVSGCSATGSAPVAGAETRSLGEYDLAREAFQANRFREALDHIQKSLKLNEDNADAAYLGSM